MDINARLIHAILMGMAMLSAVHLFAGQPGEAAPVETPPLQLSSSSSSQDTRSPSPTSGKVAAASVENISSSPVLVNSESPNTTSAATLLKPLASYAPEEIRNALLARNALLNKDQELSWFRATQFAERVTGKEIKYTESTKFPPELLHLECYDVAGTDPNWNFKAAPSASDSQSSPASRETSPINFKQSGFWKWENIKPYFITAGLVGVAAFLAYLMNNKIAMMRAKNAKHKLPRFPNRPARILQLISTQE